MRSASRSPSAGPVAARAEAQTFPEPKALEPAVAFWVRVYTEASTDGGFIHDARLMDVVYEHVRFSGETRPRARGQIVDSRKNAWREVLESLAQGNPPRNAREQQIVKLFTVALGCAPTRRPTTGTRKTSCASSSASATSSRTAWSARARTRSRCARCSARTGLPDDLALLPHVESSLQRARVFEVRRRGDLAVHARHGPALHEGRLRDRRAPRPDHRDPGARRGS